METEMSKTDKLKKIVKAYKNSVFFRLFPFPRMFNLSVRARKKE
jgi:hypothetical protein